MIEEVKKIFRELFWEARGFPANTPVDIEAKFEELAQQINQLLRKETNAISYLEGYLKGREPKPEEDAELIGRLLKRGWIPPEEAKNYVLIKPDEGRLIDFTLILSGQGTDYQKFKRAVEAQRDLTASDKDAEYGGVIIRLAKEYNILLKDRDAECQERVGGIIDLLNVHIDWYMDEHGVKKGHGGAYKALSAFRQALKKKEGVK